MARFHINEKGEPGMCRATKRCPYGDLEKDHYPSATKAREAYEEDQATFSPNPALPPLKEALVIQKPRIYSEATGVSVEYDSYGPPGWDGCECPEDDYCRCSVYEGLRVESVDMDATLSYATGIPKDQLPESLKSIGRKHGLDSPDGYDVYATNGYYGEEYSVSYANRGGLQQDLDRWHARHCVDARDPAALYLASKGHDPRKMDGLKLMKKHLKSQVPATTLQKAKHMKSSRLNYTDILKPPASLQSAKASAAELDVKAPVRGVVLKTTSGYQLIDGVEEYRKGAASTSASGIFIILE